MCGVDPNYTSGRGRVHLALSHVRESIPDARRERHPSDGSPQVRGWARQRSCARRLRHHSPACAGMDPRLGLAPGRLCWLPRMRWDGPGTSITRRQIPLAPLHARGWTQPGNPGQQAQTGPPHARGSTFLLLKVRHLMHGSPARRARECTLQAGHRGPVERGSPACAGIDPTKRLT